MHWAQLNETFLGYPQSDVTQWITLRSIQHTGLSPG